MSDDIDSGASEAEIRDKLPELQHEAQGQGEDVGREAKELREELENRLP